MIKNIKTVCAALLATCLYAGNAFAGGFQLSEYSATNQGRSFAGVGIAGDDYSAIAYNPAGMTLLGSGAQLGSHLVIIHAKARGHIVGQQSTGNGNINDIVPIPYLFGQLAYDDWRFGLGVYSPFGMGLRYNNGWFGKDHALTSKIECFDIAPSVAYKICDELSLGASLIIRHMRPNLSNTARNGGLYSNMKALGTNLTYQVGIMYEPSKDWRFGLNYRHKSTNQIHGPHTVDGITSQFAGYHARGTAWTGLTLPEHIQFSAFHRLNDSIDLTASVKWTRWSRFKVLAIHSTVASSSVDEDWKNSWTVAGGLDYHWNKFLTLRTGVAWDQAGVPDEEHRTARIPDSDRLIGSLGFSIKYNNWQVDAAYTHVFARSSHGNHTLQTSTGPSTLVADFTDRMNLFGLQVQYTF